MKTIQCNCGEVKIEIDLITVGDTEDNNNNDSFKTLSNPMEIPKNLKRVDDLFICFCCKEVVLKVTGNQVLYNSKLLKSHENLKTLIELSKDVSKTQLFVTLDEKQRFSKDLDSRARQEIATKKDFYDKKIDEILLEFQVYKQNVEDMVSTVKDSLVVKENRQDKVEVTLTPETKTETSKFTKGDEIFQFDELENDDDKDLPSDLESEGNETPPEELPEQTTNPHPNIFGSLPIQITVNRATPVRQDTGDEDKTFEPPHVFAARTFQETDLPAELIQKILLYLSFFGYSKLTLLNSKFHQLTQPLLYQKTYCQRIISLTTKVINPKVCAGLLSCLYKREYCLGALRLFTIDYQDLIQALRTNPNPSDIELGRISSCFLDYHDLIVLKKSNLDSNKSDSSETSSITRYSERMDLGTFLVQINFKKQTMLYRCKPTGHATPFRPYGSGTLVVWDEETFGRCEVCRVKLNRLQVCEACRVVYYCSLECQRCDWAKHKEKCKSLGFYINE